MHIEVIARAFWTAQGRVLLCRNVEHGYYYLPGGHVEPGEPARVALAREFVEETGHSPTVGECCLVSEVLFEARRKRHHEINLIFRITDPPPPNLASREPELAFEWAEQASIVDLDLRPQGVKAWLASDTRSEGPHPLWLEQPDDAV